MENADPNLECNPETEERLKDSLFVEESIKKTTFSSIYHLNNSNVSNCNENDKTQVMWSTFLPVYFHIFVSCAKGKRGICLLDIDRVSHIESFRCKLMFLKEDEFVYNKTFKKESIEGDSTSEISLYKCIQESRSYDNTTHMVVCLRLIDNNAEILQTAIVPIV